MLLEKILKKNQTKHKTDTLLMQRLVAYWNEPKHVCHCAALRPRDHFIPFQKGNLRSKRTEISITVRYD